MKECVSQEPLGRLHGLETEWPISVPGTEGEAIQLPCNLLGRYALEYFSLVPHVRSGSNFWTTDGGRKYIDCGEHFETATPECIDLDDTVSCDIADEQRMYGMMQNAVALNQGADPPANFDKFAIHKRVIADNSHLGCHESYSALRKAVGHTENGVSTLSPAKLALVGIHMATRGIFFGVGGLLVDGSYVIAQKASQANIDFSIGTTSSVAVVNTREEPHAESSKYARVHLTMGDANMSPWANRMKVGTTSLVLKLAENDIRLPKLRFKESLDQVSRLIARDVTLSERFMLEAGGDISALEAQTRLMLAAKRMAKTVRLAESELWVLAEWEEVCAKMAQGIGLVRDKVEWALKLDVLNRAAERHGMGWKSDELRKKERQWDFIGPKGIGLRLRETRWSQWMPPEELITRRMTEAPENTRAHLRGRFVRAFPGVQESSVNWSELARLKPRKRSATINDPYKTTHPTVDRWIEEAALKMAS